MKIRTLLIILITGLLFSCSKDDETEPSNPNTNNGDGTPEVSDNTVIVSEETKSDLIMIDSTKTKIVFSKGDSKIEDLEPGDIIVSDMTERVPDGYLLKIVKVEDEGGNIVLTTEQAKITDAVKEDHVKYSYTINKSDIIGLDTSGIDITTRGTEIVFSFDNRLYDADGDGSTRYDQVNVDGEVSFEMEVDFQMDIEDYKLEYFKFAIDTENQYELSLTAGGNIDKIETEEIVLATFQLAPLTIPAAIPIPVAKQWLVLVLDGSGKIKVELETSLTCGITGNSGIEYIRGNGWGEIYEHDSSCDFTPPELGGEVSAKTDLQFRYEIRPFGLKSSRIFLGIKGYGKAKITPEVGNSVVPWELKWGADLFGNAQMQLFNSTVANYDEELNLFENIIASGEILVGGGTYEGDIILSTMEDIENFGSNNYSVIDGNIIIGPEFNPISTINSLEYLNSIERVNGSVIIFENDKLNSLDGLSNLAYIASNLEIKKNIILTDFCALDKLVKNNGITGSFILHSNGFNPTIIDIENGNCSK